MLALLSSSWVLGSNMGWLVTLQSHHKQPQTYLGKLYLFTAMATVRFEKRMSPFAFAHPSARTVVALAAPSPSIA